MFTQGEAMTMMAVSIVGEWAVGKVIVRREKALQKFREAQKVRARDEARQEVADALADLARARAAAGLPPSEPVCCESDPGRRADALGSSTTFPAPSAATRDAPGCGSSCT